MGSTGYDAVHRALSLVRDRLPRLVETLALSRSVDLSTWEQTLDARVLPRLSPDFPLMVAITGGGSSGKSTLFNAILGRPVSITGGRAGLNRRVLVAVNPAQLERASFLSELFRPFGSAPRPLDDKHSLTIPGPPLYSAVDSLPSNLVLMDTPDFDVGAQGKYLNRDLASPVLTAADVLIYVFTNANYNAKANTDFVREQLTRIGQRPSVLVYRAYESFTPQEVLEHAETVANNLYGKQWRDHVLAIFRADDSNRVASGEAPLELRAVAGESDLVTLLAGLDPRRLRREQSQRMVVDVSSEAEKVLAATRVAVEKLELYRDALRLARGHAVAKALSQLPLDAILQRTRTAFEKTDPGFIRFSRAASRVTGAPYRGLMWLVGGRRSKKDGDERGAPDPLNVTRAQLVEAANDLRRESLADDLVTSTTSDDEDGARLLRQIDRIRAQQGPTESNTPRSELAMPPKGYNIYVQAHEALSQVRRKLVEQTWTSQLKAIESAAEKIVEIPAELDVELVAIVDQFRRDLSFIKKARASLVASLNVLPPIAGIAYILTTYDPVGASTIAGKLHGLFGLNDLWATVSIPASSGLDQATRRDLERLLQPVVQTWFATRAAPVQALFDEHITGSILVEAERRLELSRALIVELEANLAQCSPDRARTGKKRAESKR